MEEEEQAWGPLCLHCHLYSVYQKTTVGSYI